MFWDFFYWGFRVQVTRPGFCRTGPCADSQYPLSLVRAVWMSHAGEFGGHRSAARILAGINYLRHIRAPFPRTASVDAQYEYRDYQMGS